MAFKAYPPGPPTGGSVTDVFPDVHHKMSKKIAQLTKVIYHLNTKNEDHTMEMEALRAQHNQDIQQLISESAMKISKMKDMVDLKQATMNQDQTNEKLIRKHDLEKKQFLQEFQAFKQKSSEKEQKIAAEYQTKYDALKNEMEKLNNKFLEKMQQFDTSNSDLRKALEETRRIGGNNVDELKRKHDNEIKLLKEQFQNDLSSRLQMTKDESLQQAKLQFEKELGQVRASLTGDKQEGLMALKRDYDEKMQLQRDEYQLKLDKAYNDWKCLQDDLQKQETKMIMMQNEHQRVLQSQQGGYTNQIEDKDNQIKNLVNEISIKQQEILQYSARVAEREEEIQRLNKLIGEKNTKIVNLEDSLKKSNDDKEKIKSDLLQTSQSSTEKDQSFKLQLVMKENEISKLEKDIESLRSQVKRLEDKKLASESSLSEMEIESRRIIGALEKDKLELESRFNEFKLSAHHASDVASQELAALCQRMQHREDAMNKERNDIIASHTSAMESLMSKSTREMDALKSELEASQLKHTAREKQLLQDISDLKKQSSSEVEELVSKYKLINEELTSKLSETRSEWTDKYSELDAKYHSLQSDLQRETDIGKQLKAKLENQILTLQMEFDAKKRELSHAEANAIKLKDQISNLKDEMEAKETFYNAKISSSSSTLASEFQRRLDEQIEADRQTLLAVIETEKKNSNKELVLLQKRHEEEILILKKLLQSEADKAAEESAVQERERIRLENQIQQERMKHTSDINDLAIKQKEREKQFDENKRIEIDAIRRELQSIGKDNEALFHAKLEKELSDRKLEHEKVMNDLKMQHSVAISNALQSSEASFTQRLKDLEHRLTNQFSSQLIEKEKYFEELKTALQGKHDHEMERVTHQIEGLNKSLNDVNAEKTTLLQVLKQHQESFQATLVKHSQEIEEMLRQHQLNIDHEKSSSMNQIQSLREQHLTEMNVLKSDHAEARNKLSQELSDIQQSFNVLNHKYMNRESRPEDIHRIAVLEKEAVEKDALVAKTRDEMLYFKREMLNREENYNQKFNSKPVVGVMQVVKPKDMDNVSVTSKGHLPKTKPAPINVTNSKASFVPMAGVSPIASPMSRR